MTLKVAKRGRISPFIVMDVMRASAEREAAGESVIHMEVGQPGTPAPEAVLAAAERAVRNDLIGYTDARGIPPLRESIAAHYQRVHGLTVDPQRIQVTTGSSGGFLVSFLAAFDVGDRVALAAPGYPAYRNILTALGVESVLLPTSMADRFQPTSELLDAVEGRLDGLIVASPSNPTGTMVDRAALAHLVDYCADKGIRLISDEIYHGITFGTQEVSALALTDHAIVVNSFSKYFSMTGWRLGWLVLPEDLLRPAECISQNLFISAPALSQHAALAAFDCNEVLQGYVDVYRANRDLLLAELPKIGLDRLAPADGAFYIYADVSAFTQDSEGFCRAMLESAGVAATPGTDFDPLAGHRFVRLSFAGTTADMAQAIERLGPWLRSLRQS
ncbi:MAG: pyridoxal phosphate-dependent aminotransferase [Pseudomonadota bacterium]